MNRLAAGMLPVLLCILLGAALLRRQDVYNAFIQGAKGGIALTLKTLPHMMAMLMAVRVVEASGGFLWLEKLLAPVLRPLGVPAALLPLMVMRPFSGSGAMGVLAGVLSAYGADSAVGRAACMYMGSSETILYVSSLYFGSIGVQQTRYTLPAALTADMAGLLMAVWICG